MIAAVDGPAEDLLLDPGPGRGRRAVQRTCIVTRAVKPPSALIRFVLAPDGAVVPDLRARLPGRGAWVSATREALETAVKRRQFRRAFRSERAEPAADLPDRIAEALRADLRQAIALANKAGCVVAGFAKVEAEIAGRPGISALIHACDASADGRRKLGAALFRRYGDAISAMPVIDALSNAELDMALGRDHVIHAALVAGAGSNGSLACWRRLRAFEGKAAALAETGPARAGATASDLHDDEMTDRPGPRRLSGDGTTTTLKGSD